MEQALRAVERLVEEQRGRLFDLQRGHAQIEEALGQVRIAKPAESRTAERRNRTPTPADRETAEKQPRPLTPPRTPQRTPREEMPFERTPQSTSYLDVATPITEVSSRTPRSQRSSRHGDENPHMLRSSTDPNLSANSALKMSYRDDPRYKETGKEYAAWPPYPEWQDMPLRRFGNGYGKKNVPHQPSNVELGGYCEKHMLGLQTQHGDQEMVDGLARGIGHGKHHFDHANGAEDHFASGCIPRPMAAGQKISDWDIGHGKHHFYVKDHLNDECSTEVSSSRGSRHSRRESSCRGDGESSRSSGTASRPRSTR